MIPTPDPAPHTGHAPVTTTWAYHYTVQAEDWRTHHLQPGITYTCHITPGHRRCAIHFQIHALNSPAA
jgi:NADPH-dependent ferric siderophore reductase